MLLASTAGPSSEGIALVVGCAGVTVSMLYGVIGYFARHFMAQQQANHQDTLTALDGIRDIKAQLGPIKVRVDRIEAIGLIAGAVVGWFMVRHRPPDKVE